MRLLVVDMFTKRRDGPDAIGGAELCAIEVAKAVGGSLMTPEVDADEIEGVPLVKSRAGLRRSGAGRDWADTLVREVRSVAADFDCVFVNSSSAQQTNAARRIAEYGIPVVNYVHNGFMLYSFPTFSCVRALVKASAAGVINATPTRWNSDQMLKMAQKKHDQIGAVPPDTFKSFFMPVSLDYVPEPAREYSKNRVFAMTRHDEGKKPRNLAKQLVALRAAGFEAECHLLTSGSDPDALRADIAMMEDAGVTVRCDLPQSVSLRAAEGATLSITTSRYENVAVCQHEMAAMGIPTIWTTYGDEFVFVETLQPVGMGVGVDNDPEAVVEAARKFSSMPIADRISGAIEIRRLFSKESFVEGIIRSVEMAISSRKSGGLDW